MSCNLERNSINQFENLHDLLVLFEVVEQVLLLLKAPERDLFVLHRILLKRKYLEVSRPSLFLIFLINPPILDLIVEVVCLCFCQSYLRD